MDCDAYDWDACAPEDAGCGDVPGSDLDIGDLDDPSASDLAESADLELDLTACSELPTAEDLGEKAFMSAENLELEEAPLSGTSQASEAMDASSLAEDLEFQAWREGITADLDQATLEALWKDVEFRSPREVELVDAALHPEYESQMIFRTDEVTGRALRDENGEWVTDIRRSAGTQVPDGFLEDDLGLHIREDKCYGSAANLMRNIEYQTAARRAAFGDNADITYVISPKFTVEEADRIQQFCEDTLGVSLEWQD